MITKWITTDDAGKDHFSSQRIGMAGGQIRFLKIKIKTKGNNRGNYDHKFPIY